MSGIFGIINKGQKIRSESCVTTMLQVMQHRGPDGCQVWQDETALLGHLMLHTTPQSCFDRQPLLYHHWVITADVRLDNRGELGNRLGIPAALLPEQTDSLLLAKAFARWGEQCVDYLIGDFAFAIWDTKAQSLFCAKDHTGVRQLFYYEDAHFFVFASEIPAIAQLEFVPVRLNEATLKAYLINLSQKGKDAANTFLTGIYRLRPAHWLRLENGSLKTHLYWQRDPEKQIRFSDERDYGLALRAQMEQAIADRMRTNFPVGVTLSGGLDSSTIACLAARQLAASGKPLYSASSVLPADHSGIEEDERAYIELLVGQEKNIVPNYVTAPGIGVFDGLDKVFRRTYEPANPFHYMDTALNEALAPQTRIVLSGYAGDCTVSNYGQMALSCLFRHGQLTDGLQLLRDLSRKEQTPYLNLILSQVVAPLLPPKLLTVLLRLKGNSQKQPFRLTDCPVNERFVSEQQAAQWHQNQQQTDWHKQDHYNSIWDTDDVWFLGEEGLTAHHRQEHAHPFTDKRIIEFLWASPPELFIYKGVKRGYIRRAMEGVLPEQILWRPDKTPYSPDFQARLAKEAHTLSEMLEHSTSETAADYLNLPYIREKLAQISPSRNWVDFDRSTTRIVSAGIQTMQYIQWLARIN